jgi:Mn-dependent DtxR family transcriptional regulator
VTPEIDEVCIGVLQTLYVNMERAQGYSTRRLAEALEFNLREVEIGLREMAQKGLVEQVPVGYRITKKGYIMVYQRESSYCPHL